MTNSTTFRTASLFAGSLLGLSTLAACAPDVATASVNNSTYVEHVSGTRDSNTNSFLRGSATSVTLENSIKLDGSGSEARGDVYFRNGELSGGYWSKGDQDGHAPGFVAGQVETKTTVENVTFGQNTQSSEWSRFDGTLKTFTLD